MTVEKYRYRAFHEELHTCYYVEVRISKYGPLGLRYPGKRKTGRSKLEDGLAGIYEEQARLKGELLRELRLEVVEASPAE